jgi:GWxTD domain-containing protein
MKTIALILATVCWLGGNAFVPFSEPAVKSEDDFIDQAKLIMSNVEIQIYTHLATAMDRDEFIADFWKKRDPSPATEENEFKEDFSKRVEFANRWFHEKGPAASGWNSERGNILLMLGFPDQRDQMPMLDNPRIKAAEIWIYNNFALRLVFIDSEGFGRFRLEYWPLELLDAITQVKSLSGSAGKKNYFRFKVGSDASGLRIDVPVKYAIVEERGEDIRSAFTITVDIYCDYVKLERLTLTREFVETRAEFTARKSFVIAVPYSFPKAGKYFMDVVAEELVSGQRYRDFARFKRSGKS